MLVHFTQPLTATETFTLGRFGEVRLAAGGRLYIPSTLNELRRQIAKEVSALAAIDADVVGLMELENDAPPSSAIEELVAALNAPSRAGARAEVEDASPSRRSATAVGTPQPSDACTGASAAPSTSS